MPLQNSAVSVSEPFHRGLRFARGGRLTHPRGQPAPMSTNSLTPSVPWVSLWAVHSRKNVGCTSSSDGGLNRQCDGRGEDAIRSQQPFELARAADNGLAHSPSNNPDYNECLALVIASVTETYIHLGKVALPQYRYRAEDDDS
jgi:hypothetical protein